MLNVCRSLVLVTILVCGGLYSSEELYRLVDMACDITNIPESSRQAAQDRLVSYGAQIVPILLGSYKESDFGRRQILLRLLAKVGRVSEEGFLLNEFKNGDFFVQNAVRQSMPDLYARFPVSELLKRLSSTQDKYLLLAQLYGVFLQTRGADGLDPALEGAVVDILNNNPDPQIKTACVTILRYARTQPAVSALLGAINVSSDKQLLIEICSAVSYIRPRGEAKELEKLASSGDPEIEVNALGALAGMGYDNIEKALVVLCTDKSIAVRVRAFELLGHYGGIKYIKELATGLKDSDPVVRLSVVKALGELSSPQTSAYLRPLMGEGGDPVAEVRAAAAIAFHRGNRIGASGPLIRDAANIKPGYKKFRIEAIRALGGIKARESLRVLYEALESQDVQVASAAAKALGDIGDKSAISVLKARKAGAEEQIGVSIDMAINKLNISK